MSFSILKGMDKLASEEYSVEMDDDDELWEQEIEKTQRRKRFTPAEDQKLRSLVTRYGLNWKKIMHSFPNKTKRQLKDRWNYYLNPNLKSEPFTPEEDVLLESKLNEMGAKWRQIATYFPGRTDVALKNRWKMIQRHRNDENSKYQKRKKLSPHSSASTEIINGTNNRSKPKNKIKKEEPVKNVIGEQGDIQRNSIFDIFESLSFDFDIVTDEIIF